MSILTQHATYYRLMGHLQLGGSTEMLGANLLVVPFRNSEHEGHGYTLAAHSYSIQLLERMRKAEAKAELDVQFADKRSTMTFVPQMKSMGASR